MTNPQPLALLPVPHGCLISSGFQQMVLLLSQVAYTSFCVFVGEGEAGLRRQPLVSVAWAEPPVFQINRARHVVCAQCKKTKQNKTKNML